MPEGDFRWNSTSCFNVRIMTLTTDKVRSLGAVDAFCVRVIQHECVSRKRRFKKGERECKFVRDKWSVRLSEFLTPRWNWVILWKTFYLLKNWETLQFQNHHCLFQVYNGMDIIDLLLKNTGESTSCHSNQTWTSSTNDVSVLLIMHSLLLNRITQGKT